MEKSKRKVEGDLKLTQEAVSDLERINTELAQTVQRKEKEVSSILAKIEDEHTLGSKYSKQVKELQSRVDELDEELAIERTSRAKAEKNRSLLSRDLEDLGTRLEEAGSNTSTQIELNKKRKLLLFRLWCSFVSVPLAINKNHHKWHPCWFKISDIFISNT